jgi:hypothetical protein
MGWLKPGFPGDTAAKTPITMPMAMPATMRCCITTPSSLPPPYARSRVGWKPLDTGRADAPRPFGRTQRAPGKAA